MRFFLLMVSLLVGSSALAQDNGAPVEQQPDAIATFNVAVADFVAGTRFEGLSGVVHVAMESRAEDAVTTVMNVACDSLRAGPVPLGALKGSWTRSSESSQSRVNLELLSPLGRVQLVAEANFDIDLVSKTVTLNDGPMTGAVLIRLPVVQALSGVFGVDYEGSASLDMSIAGTASAPEFSLRAELKDGRRAGHDIGTLQLDWQHAKRSRIRAKWMHAGRAVVDAGFDLPLVINAITRDVALTRDASMSVTAKVLGLDDTLARAFWAIPRRFDFTLSGDTSLSGPLGQLAGKGHLEGTAGAGKVKAPLTADFSSDGTRHDLAVSWGDMVELVTTSAFSPSLLVDDRPAIGAAPWTGDVKVNLPIDAFGIAIPGLRDGRGSAGGRVTWEGTVNAPTFDGTISAQDAAFTSVLLHRRLSDVTMRLDFSGEQAAWEVGAKAAPGTLSARGTLGFSPTGGDDDGTLWSGWRSSLSGEIVAQKFPFVHRDFPLGLFDGQLTFKGARARIQTDVSAVLGTSTLQLIAEQLPKTESIATNNDLKFVEEIGSQDDHTNILRLGIDVVDLHIVGDGTDLSVAGEVKVHREDDIVRVDGGLGIKPDGVISIFDNTFSVMNGRVALAPGHLRRPVRIGEDGAPEPSAMEPIIALAAQSEVEGTYVLLRLDGAMKRPTLTLASLPAVPEYQIMTLLVTGRVDAVDDRDGNVRKAVARLVERYNNPSLQRQLFDRLGIDKVGLGFASSITTPVLSVGKQLTKTLYVETVYRHGASDDVNMMEGHIEKRLSPHWTVDTTFGEAAEGRAGLFWRRKFGAPPTKEPAPDEWSSLEPPEDVDSDADGIPNAFDLCATSAEDVDGYQDADGCPDPDNDEDGIPDTDDAAPLERETMNGLDDLDGAPDDAPARLSGLEGSMQPIRFGRNATGVAADAQRRIVAVAEVVRLLGPGVQLTVNGYSDAKGTDATKLRVSRARADAVRNALIRAGVPRDIITVVAKGDADRLNMADTPEAEAMNRRVELDLRLPDPDVSDVPKPRATP
ncbi:MAG: translocation/assembly module TamB domain-containing protein [bacterium]